MRLKKSACLLILLSASSVSLLVFSTAATPETVNAPVIPVKCAPAKCCTQMNEPKTISTWDMIPQIVWKSEA